MHKETVRYHRLKRGPRSFPGESDTVALAAPPDFPSRRFQRLLEPCWLHLKKSRNQKGKGEKGKKGKREKGVGDNHVSSPLRLTAAHRPRVPNIIMVTLTPSVHSDCLKRLDRISRPTSSIVLDNAALVLCYGILLRLDRVKERSRKGNQAGPLWCQRESFEFHYFQRCSIIPCG